jgi:hypothetical protein
MRHALAQRLRFLADRLSPETAIRRTGLRFGFVDRVGLVVNMSDTVGCPLWYYGPDYEQAHDPAVAGVAVRRPAPKMDPDANTWPSWKIYPGQVVTSPEEILDAGGRGTA